MQLLRCSSKWHSVALGQPAHRLDGPISLSLRQAGFTQVLDHLLTQGRERDASGRMDSGVSLGELTRDPTHLPGLAHHGTVHRGTDRHSLEHESPGAIKDGRFPEGWHRKPSTAESLENAEFTVVLFTDVANEQFHDAAILTHVDVGALAAPEISQLRTPRVTFNRQNGPSSGDTIQLVDGQASVVQTVHSMATARDVTLRAPTFRGGSVNSSLHLTRPCFPPPDHHAISTRAKSATESDACMTLALEAGVPPGAPTFLSRLSQELSCLR